MWDLVQKKCKTKNEVDIFLVLIFERSSLFSMFTKRLQSFGSHTVFIQL